MLPLTASKYKRRARRSGHRHEDFPFRQCAGIHKNGDFTCVEPLSGYRRTLRDYEGYAVYLAPDAPEEALGQALLEALDKSRFVDPIAAREFFQADLIMKHYRRWQDELKTRFGYRSRRQAYKNMVYCLAKRTGGTISIKPHKTVKPEYWTDLPDDQTVVIPATTDPLVAGAALKLALSGCQ